MPDSRHLGGRRPIREFDLIRTLRHRFGDTGPGVLDGIGDDAAILQPPPDRHLLVTTDLLSEGIHFDRRFSGFKEIGYKAAVANLSDIAAMGGIPHSLLVALAIPPSCTASEIQSLYHGLMVPCRTHEVTLIGGDTSSSLKHLLITITMLGWVEMGKALTREGARTGDLLFVSGTLGDAYGGLKILKKRKRQSGPNPLRPHERYLVARHMRPTPRIALGRLLATHQLASSVIDLSDGLSGDIRHICQRSRVGVTIQAEALPLSPQCRRFAREQNKDPVEFALTGGEDYELLFAVPPTKHHSLIRHAQQLPIRLTCIGTIRSHTYGIRLQLPDGSTRNIPHTSFEHGQVTGLP